MAIDGIGDYRVVAAGAADGTDVVGLGTEGVDGTVQRLEVVGDPECLHQVVSNLLANARTHTPSGTQVSVRLARESGAVHLQVRDDGPGIPPDLLPHVAERFARGDTGRARSTGSTGLGLSIVSAVVAEHGGELRIDSRPGDTRFEVVLPVAGPPTPPSST